MIEMIAACAMVACFVVLSYYFGRQHGWEAGHRDGMLDGHARANDSWRLSNAMREAFRDNDAD